MEIPIFYTVDKNYLPYFSTSLLSLIDFSNKDNKYVINVLYEQIDNDDINFIKEFEKDNIQINFYNMKEKIESTRDRLSNKLKLTHFPISIYFRMFIPRMFPEYDKGIYIDSDTILNDDIFNLYNHDLTDYLIAGCNDTSVSGTVFVEYYEKYCGVARDKYINSGVLVLNMKRLRELEFDKRFLEILTKYDFEVVEPDQAYINVLCKDHILYLDNNWNTMPIMGKDEIENPRLIHYNLFLKPWHYDVSYDKYFWHYANISPFKDMIIKEKENYTDKDKENDQNILKNMENQAERLMKSDISFKIVFNDNKERRLL